MIVCVCNNVNVNTLKSHIEEGADSLEKLRTCTGAGDCCGKCQFKVNRVLQQHSHLTQTADNDGAHRDIVSYS